jgi:hypothetical protein
METRFTNNNAEESATGRRVKGHEFNMLLFREINKEGWQARLETRRCALLRFIKTQSYCISVPKGVKQSFTFTKFTPVSALARCARQCAGCVAG